MNAQVHSPGARKIWEKPVLLKLTAIATNAIKLVYIVNLISCTWRVQPRDKVTSSVTVIIIAPQDQKALSSQKV